MADPRRMPKQIRRLKDGDGSAWWYEDERGIEIIHEMRTDSGTYVRTEHLRIPWGQLLRAAQRSSGKEVIVRG